MAPHPTPEDGPFALVDPRRPRSSYAMSKAVSESMVLLRQDQYAVRVARYYNVYGPRMGNSHVIPQFIGRIVDGVDPFPIYGAYQSRAFCYVDDAAEASLRITQLSDRGPIVVNIGDDRAEIRIIDLANRLFDLAGVHPRLAIEAPPPGSPERRLPSLRRLRSLAPGLAHTDLDTGLRTMLTWYSDRSPNGLIAE